MLKHTTFSIYIIYVNNNFISNQNQNLITKYVIGSKREWENFNYLLDYVCKLFLVCVF